MEQVAIIVLLIIILLLLADRNPLAKQPRKSSPDSETKLPSVMGATKQRKRQSPPTNTLKGQQNSASITDGNFESETGSGKSDDLIVNVNPDDIPNKDNDWEQEEEEWKYQDSNIESGFATGVTFQELSAAGQLLQNEMPEPDLQKEAVAVIQKIQGTRLFDLLEHSLGKASGRIAKLLSTAVADEDLKAVTDHKKGVEGFDIEEFI